MKRKVKWRKKSGVKTAAAIGCALLIAGAVSAFACVHFELQSYNTIQAGSEKREEAYITNSENALDYPFYLSLYGGKLAKDQKVIILAKKSGWVKIMYSENGKLKTGFVKKDSLRYRRREDQRTIHRTGQEQHYRKGGRKHRTERPRFSFQFHRPRADHKQ